MERFQNQLNLLLYGKSRITCLQASYFMIIENA